MVHTLCWTTHVHDVSGSPGRATRHSHTGRARHWAAVDARRHHPCAHTATHCFDDRYDPFSMTRPAIKQFLPSPRARARMHRRAPLEGHRWNRLSACSPSNLTIWTSPLAPTGASTTTHCLATSLSLPNFEQPWTRRYCIAGGARWRRHWPQIHHLPGPLVDQDQPFLAGGELPCAAGDPRAMIWILQGPSW
jgi:hypothetical protein